LIGCPICQKAPRSNAAARAAPVEIKPRDEMLDSFVSNGAKSKEERKTLYACSAFNVTLSGLKKIYIKNRLSFCF
jgi:hypothetical protein